MPDQDEPDTVWLVFPGNGNPKMPALEHDRRYDLALEPCPCIQATGMSGRFSSQFYLERPHREG